MEETGSAWEGLISKVKILQAGIDPRGVKTPKKKRPPNTRE